jgi:hypothetical protein
VSIPDKAKSNLRQRTHEINGRSSNHQHFNPSPEPVRYFALKPWGFTYHVEDLSKTDQDIKSGGTQIEYKDQDPEIHQTFLVECKKRGTQPKIAV